MPKRLEINEKHNYNLISQIEILLIDTQKTTTCKYCESVLT